LYFYTYLTTTTEPTTDCGIM